MLQFCRLLSRFGRLFLCTMPSPLLWRNPRDWSATKFGLPTPTTEKLLNYLFRFSNLVGFSSSKNKGKCPPNLTQSFGKDLAPDGIGKHTNPQYWENYMKNIKQKDYLYFWRIFALCCLWGLFLCYLRGFIFRNQSLVNPFSLQKCTQIDFENCWP